MYNVGMYDQTSYGLTCICLTTSNDVIQLLFHVFCMYPMNPQEIQVIAGTVDMVCDIDMSAHGIRNRTRDLRSASHYASTTMHTLVNNLQTIAAQKQWHQCAGFLKVVFENTFFS